MAKPRKGKKNLHATVTGHSVNTGSLAWDQVLACSPRWFKHGSNGWHKHLALTFCWQSRRKRVHPASSSLLKMWKAQSMSLLCLLKISRTGKSDATRTATNMMLCTCQIWWQTLLFGLRMQTQGCIFGAIGFTHNNFSATTMQNLHFFKTPCNSLSLSNMAPPVQSVAVDDHGIGHAQAARRARLEFAGLEINISRKF